MLVKKICDVPNDVFINAYNEIVSIDWSSIVDPSRKTTSNVFSTSTSIHLRVHDVDPNNKPQTMKEYCSIINCVDTDKVNLYKNCYNLAKFVYDTVNGKRMGRIMIVRLEAGGSVAPHIDPYEYFETYARFHIPLITNDKVVFNGGENTVDEHMPTKHICRLNNRKLHSVENRSDTYRVHVICDIELDGGNNIF